MNRVLFISVKPEFADKIFDGSKQIELRKCAPSVSNGDTVIIYSTVPEKAVLGTCIVADVIKDSPTRIWRTHSNKLGIDKKRYFDYYKDTNVAVGIVLKSAEKLQHKLPLEKIKKRLPKFSPPQTFKYLSKIQFDRVFKAIE